MRNFIKRRAINFIVKHVFKGVTDKDFLYSKGKKVYIKGQPANESQKSELKSQSQLIRSLSTYQIVRHDLEGTAYQMMAERSKSWEDVFFAKAVLYVIDLMDRKYKNLSQLDVNVKKEESVSDK